MRRQLLHILVFVVWIVVGAALFYSPAGDLCYTHREILCAAAKDAARLLEDGHAAKAKLVEAIELARCE